MLNSVEIREYIVVNVYAWRGHIHAGQILPEVLVPHCDTDQTGRRLSAGSDVPTGAHQFLTDALKNLHSVVVNTSPEGIIVASYIERCQGIL